MHDLPKEWTDHFGAFMALGDSVILGTCRECFSVVASDFFSFHTEWHLEIL